MNGETSAAFRPRTLRHLAWLAIALAVVTRAAFLESKPFWRDEAWVALLVQAPLGPVAEPRRPAPIGFLALTKLAALLPGVPPEVSFRVLPLLCGLAALGALYRLAMALGASATVAVTALWIAAGLPGLIYYSRELKSYGIDLLLAVLVPLLTLRLLGHDAEPSQRGGASRAAYPALAASLAAAPWISFGAQFPILTTLGWGWASLLRTGGARMRRRWTAATTIYCASFAAAYALVIHGQSTRPRLLDAWRGSLLGAEGLPSVAAVASAILTYFQASLAYLFPSVWLAIVPVAIVGSWGWPRPWRGLLLWLCLGTAAAVVAAAMANRYLVVHGRFLLFTAPVYVLYVAAGLTQFGCWFDSRIGQPWGQRLVLGVAIIGSLCWEGASVLHRVRPYHNDVAQYFFYDVLHDVEPLITHIGRHLAPGDVVIVSGFAAHSFRFYARGRLSSATVLDAPYTPGAQRAPWPGLLATIRQHAWILLLEEEDQEWLRSLIDEEGFERQVGTSRGALLWEVTRRAR